MKGMLNMKESLDYSASVKHLVEYFKGEVVVKRENEYKYLQAKKLLEVINIFESDAYQNVSDRYQVIITNPPIRAGKEVVYRILLGAKEHLLPDGGLYCVIHKDQGAKSTISDLEKSYNVSILEKNKGFFVIKCTSC